MNTPRLGQGAWTAPLLGLAACLPAFYGPILWFAGSAVTGTSLDPVAHMLTMLGDDQPAGRGFHYFDLAVNTRLWCDDVTYHPFHLVRWLSIALGSNPIGWSALIVGLHSLVFGILYAYSRVLLRASAPAAWAGATVAFFAVGWPMWTAAVHPTAALILLTVSACEYALFLRTRRRRHLLLCALANALQPYLAQSLSLLPTQLYLLGAACLVAHHRRERWAPALSPLVRIVWPLSLLAWVPILAPLVYAVGSGLTVREALAPRRWAVDPSSSTQLLGVLFPVPNTAWILWTKLGLLGIGGFSPPAPWFFGSFLFPPCLLALWQWRQRLPRTLLLGVALYLLSVVAAESVLTPSPLSRALRFWLPLGFPMLSGFVVAAGMDRLLLPNAGPKGIRILHGLYGLLLGAALLGGWALRIAGQGRLTEFAFRRGWAGSGAEIPTLIRSTELFAAGIAVGLLAYFCLRVLRRLRPIALFLAVVAPALCLQQGWGLYARHRELDAMLSHPPEIRFLRQRIPDYTYRVGVVCASELLLAHGDWNGFWRKSAEPANQVVSCIRQNSPWVRQGLAFTLPFLHFHAPVHSELRREGNPSLQRPDSSVAQLLGRRNVIVRPEAGGFDDYGVRYWLSNFDLRQLDPDKFVRVADGEYGAVFENRSAKPVAYFLDAPQSPLPMRHGSGGISVAIPGRRAGKISLHLDLRRMDARAVDAKGRASPLALEPSGLRWSTEVPVGTTAVLFTPNELRWLKPLAIGSVVTFLLSFALLSAGSDR